MRRRRRLSRKLHATPSHGTTIQTSGIKKTASAAVLLSLLYIVAHRAGRRYQSHEERGARGRVHEHDEWRREHDDVNHNLDIVRTWIRTARVYQDRRDRLTTTTGSKISTKRTARRALVAIALDRCPVLPP